MPPKSSFGISKKRYGGVEAARGVSFEIDDGEIFGLLGPNGAGKTTTVECVIGLREPDDGHDRGLRHRCAAAAARGQAEDRRGAADDGAAGQDHAARGAGALRRRSTATAPSPAALLERFALTDKADAPFDTLSGGQRQRLALALAFVNNAGARLPRRADGRAGSAVAARAARRDRGDEARRPHRAAHDALPRRSRGALRSHRDHRSRPHRRHRRAARAHRRGRRATPSVYAGDRAAARARAGSSGCRASRG